MHNQPANTKWTETEIDFLLNGIGSYGWSWFTKRLKNRTKKAIYAQILKSLGGGGITRGTYSFAQIIEITGYDRTHLLRAQQALRQKWHRTKRKGTYLITHDQLEELSDWLVHDYWSKSLRLYGCKKCGSENRKHIGNGLCTVCYHREYRREKS